MSTGRKTPNNGMNKSKLIVYGTILFSIMLFIFYMSSREADISMQMSDGVLEAILDAVGDDLSEGVVAFLVAYIRKIAHFVIYMALGIFAALTLGEWKKSEWDKKLILEYSLLFSIAYAMSDELHQKFVPGRSCEWRDVCIDSVGALLGIVVVLICMRRVSHTS